MKIARGLLVVVLSVLTTTNGIADAGECKEDRDCASGYDIDSPGAGCCLAGRCSEKLGPGGECWRDAMCIR